ncbi:MAG: hypothetical protein NTY10_01300 [Candidatus Omnitrophica bacterium]|nr:hypothetical protein [Candidatus Omnitrophota bacterium]
MFEHRHQPLLSRVAFLRRLFLYAGIAFIIVFCSLGMGILGYHAFEGLSWLDSLVNAAMILGGMGPVNELHTQAGKFFAAFYALFSGLMFLVVVGVLFAPIIHRFFHHFHLELETENSAKNSF